MSEVKLKATQWRQICRRVFTAWGAPDDIAQCVADSLVGSNLAGLDSHGVVRIVNYYNFVKPGWWQPANRPEVAARGTLQRGDRRQLGLRPAGGPPGS